MQNTKKRGQGGGRGGSNYGDRGRGGSDRGRGGSDRGRGCGSDRGGGGDRGQGGSNYGDRGRGGSDRGRGGSDRGRGRGGSNYGDRGRGGSDRGRGGSNYGERGQGGSSHGERGHGGRNYNERGHDGSNYGDTGHGGRHYTERGQGGSNYGDRNQDDRNYSERDQGRSGYGERGHGRRNYNERDHGGTNYGDTGHGGRNYNERGCGGSNYGDTGHGGRHYTERGQGGSNYGDRNQDDKNYSERDQGRSGYGERGHGCRNYNERDHGGTNYGDTGHGGRHYTERGQGGSNCGDDDGQQLPAVQPTRGVLPIYYPAPVVLMSAPVTFSVPVHGYSDIPPDQHHHSFSRQGSSHNIPEASSYRASPGDPQVGRSKGKLEQGGRNFGSRSNVNDDASSVYSDRGSTHGRDFFPGRESNMDARDRDHFSEFDSRTSLHNFEGVSSSEDPSYQNRSGRGNFGRDFTRGEGRGSRRGEGGWLGEFDGRGSSRGRGRGSRGGDGRVIRSERRGRRGTNNRGLSRKPEGRKERGGSSGSKSWTVEWLNRTSDTYGVNSEDEDWEDDVSNISDSQFDGCSRQSEMGRTERGQLPHQQQYGRGRRPYGRGTENGRRGTRQNSNIGTHSKIFKYIVGEDGNVISPTEQSTERRGENFRGRHGTQNRGQRAGRNGESGRALKRKKRVKETEGGDLGNNSSHPLENMNYKELPQKGERFAASGSEDTGSTCKTRRRRQRQRKKKDSVKSEDRTLVIDSSNVEEDVKSESETSEDESSVEDDEGSLKLVHARTSLNKKARKNFSKHKVGACIGGKHIKLGRTKGTVSSRCSTNVIEKRNPKTDIGVYSVEVETLLDLLGSFADVGAGPDLLGNVGNFEDENSVPLLETPQRVPPLKKITDKSEKVTSCAKNFSDCSTSKKSETDKKETPVDAQENSAQGGFFGADPDGLMVKVFRTLLEDFGGKTKLSQLLEKKDLFPKGCDVLSFLRKYNRDKFLLFEKDGSVEHVSVFNRKAKLCVNYNDGGCKKENCSLSYFHVCMGFVCGSCKDNRFQSHNFFDGTNISLVKQLGMVIFKNKDVAKIVRHSVPELCPEYLQGKMHEDFTCPYIHLCSQFKCCQKNCELIHSPHVSEHNKWILKVFQIGHFKENILQNKMVFMGRYSSKVLEYSDEGTQRKKSNPPTSPASVPLPSRPDIFQRVEEPIMKKPKEKEFFALEQLPNPGPPGSVIYSRIGEPHIEGKMPELENRAANLKLSKAQTERSLPTANPEGRSEIPMNEARAVGQRVPAKPPEVQKTIVNDQFLCEKHIWSQCAEQASCLHHHGNKLPYLWQIKLNYNWQDISASESQHVEQSFAQLEKSIQKVQLNSDDKQLFARLDFGEMTAAVYTWNSDGQCEFLRQSVSIVRRSTKSYAEGSGDLSALTQWCWYWQDNGHVWTPYKPDKLQFTIESKYLYGQSHYYYEIGKFHYELDLKNFIQTNLETGNQRPVIRRLVFVSASDVSKNMRSLHPHLLSQAPPANMEVPPHWSPVDQHQPFEIVKIKLGHQERERVEISFFKTMDKSDVTIKSVYRVQNPTLWHKYYGAKNTLKSNFHREGLAADVNECQLFHGTDQLHVVRGICVNNFDFRLSGKNATVYGKGAYFAKGADYSHNYTSGPSRYMFLAKVLVGQYTKGDSSLTRPPERAGHVLYDSIVNDPYNPSVFVIFDRDQCYPEYLIHYEDVNPGGTSAAQLAAFQRPPPPFSFSRTPVGSKNTGSLPAQSGHVYGQGYGQSFAVPSAAARPQPSSPTSSPGSASFNMDQKKCLIM